MLDLKGGRQSLKKIYILYISYAALGGGGRVSSHSLLGLPPLAGSLLQVHRLGWQYMLELAIIFC